MEVKDRGLDGKVDGTVHTLDGTTDFRPLSSLTFLVCRHKSPLTTP